MVRNAFSGDWIVVPRRVSSPRVRLLCFPHAGGSAQVFYTWPAALPNDVEVCAVQLPGRGRRLLEAPPTDMDQITGPLWAAFEALRNTPVAFFGHSFGAWVAFEFALLLQSKGVHLTHLFVSGASAPQLPDRESPIRDLPDAEFIAEVCRRYEGVPDEIRRDAEMMAICLPALRADITIKELYGRAESAQLECPVSAFGGLEDGSATEDRLHAWRERTRGDFRCRMFPGGHFFVDSARESVVKYVVEDLERSLSRASREKSNGVVV